MIIQDDAEDVIVDGFYIALGRAEGPGSYGGGGAIRMNDADAAIRNCRFEANSAEEGGAVQISGQSEVTIERCYFDVNSSTSKGGAINCSAFGAEGTSVIVDRCRFFLNSSEEGGAINFNQGLLIVSNSTFSQNNSTSTGDAIHAEDNLEMRNCTVVNHGSAVHVDDENHIYNCIFWSNTEDFSYGSSHQPGDQEVLYSLLSNGILPGDGNLSQDPQLSNAAALDFKLLIDSPCINTGKNVLSVGDFDFYNEARIHDQTVDIGAAEFNDPCSVSNDICTNASTIDVSTDNIIPINMECASTEQSISSCGAPDSRSRWYRFTMPDHLVEISLNGPSSGANARSMTWLVNSCIGPEQNCNQTMVIDRPAGQEILIKVMEWTSAPNALSLEVRPIFSEIISVAPTQADVCNTGSPVSTYDQQIVIHHNISAYYEFLDVNGEIFPVTASPQYIVLEDLPATGEALDVTVSIPGSSTEITYSGIIQSPCCAPQNDSCENPLPLDPGEETIGRLDCASQGAEDPLSSCTTDPGRSLWYEVYVGSSGSIELECSILELNGPFNVRMSVWDNTDGCADLVEVGCVNEHPDNVDESTTISGLTPDSYYLVMISGWQNQNGTFRLALNDVQCGCPGDFNSDCMINTGDLSNLLGQFGCVADCTGDINGDGLLNTADLAALLSVYGSSCE
jgi:predicted outer membrane repeat protein